MSAERTLRLNEFRVLYRYYRRYIGWYDHLLLGLLVWIESKVVFERTTNTVEAAIQQYEEVETPVSDYVSPIYSEDTSKGVDELPEMRLTAPWVKK